MERNNKINAMFESGKITKEQAELLKNALEDSSKNKEDFQNHAKRQFKSKKEFLIIISAFFLLLFFTGMIILAFSINSINKAGENIKYEDTYLENPDTKKPASQENSQIRMEKKQVRKKIAAVLFAGISCLLFLLVLCLFSILSYNSLVKTKENIIESWFAIRIEIKRKLDLLPALLEILSKALSHETDIIDRISNLRSKLTDSTELKETSFKHINDAINESDKLTGSILALVENYPDLKSNSSFMFLLNFLVEIENAISGQRHCYNSNVKIFNKKIKNFPGNLFALLFKISEHSYSGSIK